MEYKKAKELKVGDVVNPRLKDIYGKEIKPNGNYLVKDVNVYDKKVIITLDNGQEISHKECNHPPIICSDVKHPFYCSWFGETDNIQKTGLSREQIERCGIVPDPEYF